MFKKYCQFLFLFFLFANINTAYSKVNYQVSNVQIDESSDNATNARQMGIEKAQRTAFIIMLSRIGIDTNYAMWFSSSEIAQTIESRRISNERFSDKHYSAELTVTFSESFLKYTLDSYGISKDSKSGMSYLIVPTQKVGDEIFVWEDNNKWMESWREVVGRKGVNGILLPKADLDDISMITQDEILTPYYEDFKDVISRYNTDGVIIVEGENIKSDNKIRIRLIKINKDGIKNIKLDYFNMNNLREKYFLRDAAQNTLKYIVEVELSNGNGRIKNEGTNVYIPVKDAVDWMAINKRLESIPNFKKITTLYITSNMIKVNIMHDMTNDVFRNLLEENGLYLLTKNDKYYFLYSSKTYGEFN